MMIKELNLDLSSSNSNNKKTNMLLKKGQLAYQRGDLTRAAEFFYKAWDADPENLFLLTMVSHLLAKLGNKEVAIALLERTIELHGATENICEVIGEMASSMEMYDIAEKIYSQAINLNAANFKHYMNLAIAEEKQGKVEEAISLLEKVLEYFPDQTDIWSLLATMVKVHRSGVEAQPLYDKALELNPKDLVALNNFAECAHSVQHSRELIERAIKCDPDEPEPHIRLATMLFSEGNLKEAWRHYEHRHNPSRGPAQAIQFTHGLDEWNGKSLRGKSIFLAGEQGIGDEILFVMAITHLLDRDIEIHVGCDERLISVFERSFPGVKAYAYRDIEKMGVRYRTFPDFDAALKARKVKVDYGLPMASLGKFYWKKPADVPVFKGGYLTANDEVVTDFAAKMSDCKAKIKIGLSWRSGYVDVARRDNQYIGLERLLPLIKAVDADFVCLQYDWRDEELQMVKEKTGKSLHVFEGVDLKEDIEANLGIMKNMDIVIGPNIAPQMLALALGCEVWMPGWVSPWWNFGQGHDKSQFLHAPYSRCYLIREELGSVHAVEPWSEVIEEMTQELQKRSNV